MDGDIIRLRDELFEVVDIIRASVPVDIEEIDREILLRCIPQELLQVRKSTTCVRYGRSPNLHFPGERLHEVLIPCDRSCDGHVRTEPVEIRVWLVEAEDRVGAVVRDAEVDVRGPD